MAAPLGEGSTSLDVTASGPPGSVALRTETGDRLTPVGPASRRPTARRAPLDAANAAAEASRTRYGKTSIPASTAIDKVVPKDNTSTTTMASAPAEIAVAPCDPQSKRTPKLAWPYGSTAPADAFVEADTLILPLDRATRGSTPAGNSGEVGLGRSHGAPIDRSARSLSRGPPIVHVLLVLVQIIEAGIVIVKIDDTATWLDRGHPAPGAAWRARGFGPDLPGTLESLHPPLPDRCLDANLSAQVGKVANQQRKAGHRADP